MATPRRPSAPAPKGFMWALRPVNGRLAWTLVRKGPQPKPGQKVPWGVITGREQPGQRVDTPSAPGAPGGGAGSDPDGGADAGGAGGSEHAAEKPGADILINYLKSLGLDDETILNDAIQKFKDGWDTTAILTWLRTTDWFEAKFPGVAAGIKAGIFNPAAPEDDWRRYRGSVNAYYRQYYGRDATDAEIGQHLGAGETADYVGRRFYGSAWVTANKEEIGYLSGAFGGGALTEPELDELGKNEAGIGGALGQSLNKALQDAQQRMQRVFEGVLATGSFGQTSFGTLATSNKRPDVGA